MALVRPCSKTARTAPSVALGGASFVQNNDVTGGTNVSSYQRGLVSRFEGVLSGHQRDVRKDFVQSPLHSLMLNQRANAPLVFPSLAEIFGIAARRK